MKRPILTVVLLAAALVAVALLVKPKSDDGACLQMKDEPVIARLGERSKDITLIEVAQGTKSVSLLREGDHWVIPSTGNFTADSKRVNELLSGLASLEKVEPMTSVADRLGALQLAWPDDQGLAKLVRVMAGEQPIAEVVIGKESSRRDAQFARRLDETQAWKCTGRVNCAANLEHYIDRLLLTLPTAGVTSFTMGGVEFTRSEAGGWTAAVVADPPSLLDAQRESAQRTIPEWVSRLEIDEVRAAHEHTDSKRVSVASRARTIELTVSKDGTDLWCTVGVESTPGQSEPTDPVELERVTALDRAGERCAGFEFKLPSWRATSLSAILFPAPAAPADPEQPAPGTQPTLIPPANAP